MAVGKTHARRVERLTAAGFPPAEIARIHAPVGLDIGAISPAEIALSVLGEIVAAFAQGIRGMKFGPVPIREAVGGTLAHALKEGTLVLKKGTIIGEAHVKALFEVGIAEIVVARPEAGDIDENEAARRIAESAIDVEVVAEAAFTGRVNLFAASAGILRIDEARIHAANNVDDSITVATLPDYRKVAAGEMVATVKIIPFAVAEARAAEAAEAVRAAVRVAPFSPKRIAVVSTVLPGLKSSVIEKTLRVLDERLAGSKVRCDSATSACIMRRRISRRRSSTRGRSAPTSPSCSAPRPSLTGVMSFPRLWKRPAAPSAISACRSIRATC